jgi:hypothetical protein
MTIPLFLMTIKRILWPPWTTEAVQALNYLLLVALGAFIAQPYIDTFSSSGAFGWLSRHLGTYEDTMGVVMVLIGASAHLALWRNWQQWERVGLAFAGCLWTFWAATFWVSNPHGTGWVIYGVLALSCVWSVGRLAADRAVGY